MELAADYVRSRGCPSESVPQVTGLRVGGISPGMEALRDQRGLPWLEDVVRDVRYAARGLRRRPGFATVIVLTLALGIGANTALFSLTDALLLTTLPVQAPERLVVLSLRDVRGENLTGFSYPLFSELQVRNHTLTTTFAASWGNNPMELRVSPSTETEPARVSMVSGNFFEALGIDARFGRRISRADDQPPGGHSVAVLSDRFWRKRFGASPSILGRTIIVDQVTFTIVVSPRRNFLAMSWANCQT